MLLVVILVFISFTIIERLLKGIFNGTMAARDAANAEGRPTAENWFAIIGGVICLVILVYCLS